MLGCQMACIARLPDGIAIFTCTHICTYLMGYIYHSTHFSNLEHCGPSPPLHSHVTTTPKTNDKFQKVLSDHNLCGTTWGQLCLSLSLSLSLFWPINFYCLILEAKLQRKLNLFCDRSWDSPSIFILFFCIGTIFILHPSSKQASWCGDLPPGLGARTHPFNLCARKPWQGTFAELVPIFRH